MFHGVILNRTFVNESFLSIVVREETVDVFHCGSVLWFNGPTTHHKIPQAVRDRVLRVLWVLYTWSRRRLSLGDPRVNDRGIARETRERYFLRDALEYQHGERVRVGIHRCGDTAALDELDGRIPDNISG